MEFVAVVSHMLLAFKIRVSELGGYKYMRMIYELSFLKLSVIIVSLLLNWKVYSVQLGTTRPKYLMIKKIVKISSRANLNRIYKFYSGRILITGCFSH